MKVVKRKISELIPAEYNPRKLSPKQENDLKNSLLEFGLVDPIIVNVNADRKNVIIGGHQRLKVWRKLGNKEIDCIEVNLSLEKERELNVRLNKNTGEFDFDILLSEFEFDDLIDWGFDPQEFNISSNDINPDDFDTDFSLPEGDREPFQQMTFTLADEQAEQIKNAISDIKQTDEYKYAETMGNENSNGNALYLIVMQWAEQKI